MIVVDTNVIAYLLVPGDVTRLAEEVRNMDSEWASPILWRSEMRNVLLGYLRAGMLDLTRIKALMANAELLLSGNEYEVESSAVLELASSSACTTYDCEFVYLAEKLSVPLVTSDKKLLAAFPDIARSMAAFVA